MRDPAGEEQRGFGHIAWIEAAGAKKIAGMIQGHEGHDEAAQDVYGNDPSIAAHEFGRGNRRDVNPL